MVDWSGAKSENLLADEPYLTLLEDAKAGLWDAGHAGPPCGTCSAARWNASGPGPPPVRSKTEVYGLSSNSSGLQCQADEGTVLATRSCTLVSEVVKSQQARKVPEAGSVENPPGTEGGPGAPMWTRSRSWAT